jgi:hypothetical protein
MPGKVDLRQRLILLPTQRSVSVACGECSRVSNAERVWGADTAPRSPSRRAAVAVSSATALGVVCLDPSHHPGAFQGAGIRCSRFGAIRTNDIRLSGPLYTLASVSVVSDADTSHPPAASERRPRRPVILTVDDEPAVLAAVSRDQGRWAGHRARPRHRTADHSRSQPRLDRRR